MADDTQTVNIRIVSQLPDPHSSISFGPLPTTLTIAELKQKIRDVLPTQPLPETQRLIYLGRALTRETDTLLAIFGQDVVRQGEVQSIHLVVREPVSRDAPINRNQAMVPGPPPPTAFIPEAMRPSTTTVLQQTPFSPSQQQIAEAQALAAANTQDAIQLQNLQMQGQQIQQRMAQRRMNGAQGQPVGAVIQNHHRHGHIQNNPIAGFVNHHPATLPVFPNMPQTFAQGNNPFLANHLIHQQHLGHHPQQHLHPNMALPHGFPPQVVIQNGVQLPGRTNINPFPARHGFQPGVLPSHPLQRSISSNAQNVQAGSNDQTSVTNPNPPNAQTQTRIAIQADDPQQAMLSTVDGLIESMGIPAEERQRVREEMRRNLLATHNTSTRAGNTGSNGGLDGAVREQEETATASEPQSDLSTRAIDMTQGTGSAQSVQQTGPRTLPDGNVTGQRWTMTINASTMPFAPQAGVPPFLQVPQAPQQPNTLAASVPIHTLPRETSLRGWQGANHAIHTMTRFQNVLLEIAAEHRRANLNGNNNNHVASTAPSRSTNERMNHLQFIVRERNQYQAIVNEVLTRGSPVGHMELTAEQVGNLQGMNDRFRRLAQEVQTLLGTSSGSAAGSTPDSALSRPPSAAPAPATPTPTSTPAPRSSASANVVAYLLSSPTGPCALVYTPQGTFSTMQNSASSASGLVDSHDAQRMEGDAARPPEATRVNHAAANGNMNANGNQAGLPAQPQQQLILQQPLPGQPVPLQDPQQEDNNIVLALTPFFRTAWFFTRLCAFFWLFGGLGGTSTQRLIVVIVLSLGYHAFQVGIFRNQQEWLQRHWEGLIGGPEVRPEAGNNAAGGAAGQAGAQAAGGGEIRPEDAARRLVEERRLQDRGWARQRLRTVERAVALFIASLYPGVGERHVAERERMVREAAERDRAAAAAAAADAATPAADTLSVSSNPATAGSEDPPDPEQADTTGGDHAEGGSATKQVQEQGQSVNTAEGSSSAVAVGSEGESQLTQRKHAGAS